MFRSSINNAVTPLNETTNFRAIEFGSLAAGNQTARGTRNPSPLETSTPRADDLPSPQSDLRESHEYDPTMYMTIGVDSNVEAASLFLPFKPLHQPDVTPSSAQIAGVGIMLGADDRGRIIVVDMVRDSPASLNHVISKGDRIMTVDQKSMGSIEDVKNALAGPVGTSVMIGLQKTLPSPQEMSTSLEMVTLTREIIGRQYLCLPCQAKGGEIPNARAPIRWCTLTNGLIEIHRKNPTEVPNGKTKIKFRLSVKDARVASVNPQHKYSGRMVTLQCSESTLYLVFETVPCMEKFRRDLAYWIGIAAKLDDFQRP